MDGVNALIARGVAPPQYNVLDEAGKAQSFLARQQMMQMAPQNALLDRQLKERELQLRELALDVQRRAAEAKEDGPVSIDYPTFSVKGNRAAVANTAAVIAQYAGQFDLNDPEAMAWLASQGVSIERPKEAATKRSPVAQMLLDSGIDPQSPEGQRYIRQALEKTTQWAPEREGMTVEVPDGQGGTIRMQMGKGGRPISPMTTGTQADVEKNQIEDLGFLGDLKRIGQKYKEEYLTMWGRAKDIAGRSAAKLGVDRESMPETAEFVKNRKAFAINVERFFQRFRKEITGAQAVLKEIETLKQAVINMDQDPWSFEASFGELVNGMERAVALRSKLLNEGLRGPALYKEMDRRWASSEQATTPNPSTAAEEADALIKKARGQR